ncbi:LysR family transcriptional regulator [Nakamurella sp. YIM 132087]|uniref:LysR family transcriptional regulator n=1 Tax=Nakamurella alba TaxID=2665158 RepID=A0A7K1FI54_9ACTN|nr:LysR family transcriptional regulator [Nakamurella alba]MTD12564.1 LysR family transcriptional regulator [Nakamurella alba]
MTDLDLNKLRHLVAVAREGSFVAAAAEIPVSQSALTRSVQSLEREFSVCVFHRGRDGVRLTPSGAEFVAIAESVLREADNASNAMRALTSGVLRTPVRIGMGPISSLVFLPQLLPVLAGTGTPVEIVNGSNSRLVTLLARGELDFSVSGVPARSDQFARANQLISHRFPGDVMEPLVRTGHPLLDPAGASSRGDYPVAAGSFMRDTIPLTALDGLQLQVPTVISDDYQALAELAERLDYIVLGNRLLTGRLDLQPLPGRPVIPGAPEWSLRCSARHGLTERAAQLYRIVRDHIRTAIGATPAAEHTPRTPGHAPHASEIRELVLDPGRVG